MIYIALLRGVNVGGKGVVSMSGLKSCFEQLGFSHVRTYINSGNVIFNTEQTDSGILAQRIEAMLDQTFEPGIRVLIKTRDELKWLTEAIPADWANDSEARCDVMFLWPEIDRPRTLNDIASSPDIEDVRYYPGAIVWRIDRPYVTKSRMTRIIGTKMYKQITIRNINTVRKLLTLANEAN
jgi:uncharacterized protein (DUF1697 family)